MKSVKPDLSDAQMQEIFSSGLGRRCFLLKGLHSRKLTGIPKMMVWKRWLLVNMAIFGIYVEFLGGK